MQTQLEFIPLPETKAGKGGKAPTSLKQNNVIDLGSVTKALPIPPSAAPQAAAPAVSSRPASGSVTSVSAPEDYNYEDDY
jgi:hypothetical protein